MLNGLKLRRRAMSMDVMANQAGAPIGDAWMLLGGSTVRQQGHVAERSDAVPFQTPAEPSLPQQTTDLVPFIGTIFAATLGRDPTLEEQDYYCRLGDGGLEPNWLRATLSNLTSSPEFAARMQPATEAFSLGATLLPESPLMYHAASLGAHCYASWLLQDMGLRRCSSPFDWLFSSPQLVTHCLTDDFATLLDPTHHAQYSPHGQSLHRFYHEGFATETAPGNQPPLFFHHDTTTDKGHASLVRKVERFRRLLDSTDDKFFLMVIGKNRPQDDVETVMHSLVAAVDSRTENATVLAVAHTDVVGSAGIHSSKVWQHGRHSLHNLVTASEMVEGLSFAHYFDNLLIKRLIYQYRFEIRSAP